MSRDVDEHCYTKCTRNEIWVCGTLYSLDLYLRPLIANFLRKLRRRLTATLMERFNWMFQSRSPPNIININSKYINIQKIIGWKNRNLKLLFMNGPSTYVDTYILGVGSHI